MFKQEKKKSFARRNDIGFYLVSFDIIESEGKTVYYKRVYDSLENAVDKNNFYRTLKQYCVVRTDIVETSLVDIVREVCGEDCNIVITKLTSVPEFSFQKNAEKEDSNRLIKDMRDASEI